jgi:hypothetical protein
VRRRDAACRSKALQLSPDRRGVAQVSNQDHIRGMASRKPAFVINKRDDDLVRLGMIAMLAACFGR